MYVIQTQVLARHSYRLFFSLKHPLLNHHRSYFPKSKCNITCFRTIIRQKSIHQFLSFSSNAIRTVLNRCPKVSCLIPIYLLIKQNQFRIVRCEQQPSKINRNNSIDPAGDQIDRNFDWREFWRILSPDLLLLLLAAAVSSCMM